MLTGTPILNKPKELWPLVRVLDPTGLGSDWMAFARRYCELFEIEQFDPARGRKVHIGWKWDGAANLEELQDRLRSSCMVRRLKKDVLKELPPKIRQVIVLEPKRGLTKLLKREIMAYDEFVKQHGENFDAPAFTEISKIRKEVAIAKLPYMIDYMKEVLNEADKVVVFVHHHEVFDVFKSAFGDAATGFDGRTNNTDRQRYIDLFQNGAGPRLFIAGRAAWNAVTLTAASVGVFAEGDWVAANITQAEDRLHRIGQTESVLIRHAVLSGSLDERMAQKVIEKQSITDRTLDKEESYETM